MLVIILVTVATWLSGNVLVSINVVALCRVWLVLGWVTVHRYTILSYLVTMYSALVVVYTTYRAL